jgi:membrane-associated PAP2 superfamily phosphatase
MFRFPAALSGSRWLLYGGGLAVLVVGTILLCATPLDVWISSLFYTPGGRDRWSLEHNFIFQIIYKYGTWPTYALALVSGALLLLSLAVVRLRAWRRRLAVAFLTVVIGPWLLTNLVLKENWGRPRPRELKVFGGRWDYRPVWRPGPSAEGPSFPSGHAAMAFGLFGAVFLLRRRRPARWVGAGLAGYGTLMGLVRIVQGAHFASDVLWSAGITLGSSLILHDLVFRLPGSEGRDRKRHPEWFSGPWRIDSFRRLAWSAGAALAVAAATAAGLILTNEGKVVTRYNQWRAGPGIERVVVRIFTGRATVKVRLDDTRGENNHRPKDWVVDIQTVVRYVGPPWVDLKDRADIKRRGRTAVVTYRRRTSGWFLSLRATTEVRLNPQRPVELLIRTERGQVELDVGRRLAVRLGPLAMASRSGRINLRLGPKTLMTGPWTIGSDRGPLSLVLRDVRTVGLASCRLFAPRSPVEMTWRQGRALGGRLTIVALGGVASVRFKARLAPGLVGLDLGARSREGRVRATIDRHVSTPAPSVWRLGSGDQGRAAVTLFTTRGEVRLDLGAIGQPSRPSQ